MASEEIEVNVLTLNCWGLGGGISKDRVERMQSIGEYLAAQDYDIVLLQEVWKRSDFETIRSLVASVLPYHHFFDNGIIGTGTCIFSKTRINDVTFHHFGLNGYPHRITHGDWFGGKGLGVGQIDFKGFNIHIFTSHFHATYNYNPLKDIYIGHRVVHGVESAQWIKLSSSSADLTLYAGDFNNEPKDVPYQIVKYVTPLLDAWVEGNGNEGGETNETPGNSYTPRSALRDSPDGKRIDYILYMPGPNIDAETVSCVLPLPSRVPGKSFSYSDHEAVAAKLLIRRRKQARYLETSIRDYVRCNSILKELDTKREVVKKAKDILHTSIRETEKAKIGYIVFALLCVVLIFSSFIPPPDSLTTQWVPPVLIDLLIFLARLILVVAFFFAILMILIFARQEQNALRSTLSTLDCILDNHVADPECDAHLMMTAQHGSAVHTRNGAKITMTSHSSESAVAVQNGGNIMSSSSTDTVLDYDEEIKERGDRLPPINGSKL